MTEWVIDVHWPSPPGPVLLVTVRPIRGEPSAGVLAHLDPSAGLASPEATATPAAVTSPCDFADGAWRPWRPSAGPAVVVGDSRGSSSPRSALASGRTRPLLTDHPDFVRGSIGEHLWRRRIQSSWTRSWTARAERAGTACARVLARLGSSGPHDSVQVQDRPHSPSKDRGACWRDRNSSRAMIRTRSRRRSRRLATRVPDTRPIGKNPNASRPILRPLPNASPDDVPPASSRRVDAGHRTPVSVPGAGDTATG